MLITNVKHRVRDGGDIAGVDGFEVLLSVRSGSTSRERVQHLAHGATLVLLNDVHAVLALVGEDQTFVKVGGDGDHGQAVSKNFIGKHVDGFHNFALVVLSDALREVHTGDGQLWAHQR